MPDEYTLNLEEWIERFPLEQYRKVLESHMTFAGPFDLALVEQDLRQQQNSPGGLVDVFVFELGEPEQRHVTKIGGLPYRPANLPWPECPGTDDPKLAPYTQPAGTPMLFVAQFCFAGSRDIAGELPGDVLLIFVEDDSFGSRPHYEWYPLGLSDLVTAEQLPDRPSPFMTCFGHRCRMQEFQNRPLRATKIGGQPALDFDDAEVDGRFLCQLASLQPTFRQPYPWVNHEQPITLDEFYQGTDEDRQKRQLCLVDMGVLFLYIDGAGQCAHWFEPG